MNSDKEYFIKILSNKIEEIDYSYYRNPLDKSSIDMGILRKVLDRNKEQYLREVSLEKLNEYIIKKKSYMYHHNVEKEFLKAFENNLLDTINYSVSFEKNAFTRNDIYKVYREKISYPQKIEDCYTIALNNLRFNGKTFSLKLERLFQDIYDNVDNYIQKYSFNRNTHKRVIDCQVNKRLHHINLIESAGLPNKDYYPFYEKSKIIYGLRLQNKSIFLYPKEVINLSHLFIKKVYPKINKKGSENLFLALKDFFKGDFHLISKNDLSKRKKYFIYTMYILEKKKRLNRTLFTEQLALKNKLFFDSKTYDFYCKNFSNGEIPKRFRSRITFFDKL